MWSILDVLRRHLSLAITLAMASGLVLGLLVEAQPLRVLVLPLTILMILPMMVALDPRALLLQCRPGVQITAQVLNFLVVPLLGWITGLIFFADRPMVALGLLLVAVFPTSGMTISWTGFARGNIALATKMSVLGMVLGALLAPLYAKGLLGSVVTLPLGDLFLQIFWVLGIPLILGLLIRGVLMRIQGAEGFVRATQPRLPSLSTVGLLGLVFTAVSLKAEVLVDLALLLRLLPALVVFYAAVFGTSLLVGRLFSREDGIALVYGTAVRKVSLALALAVTTFGEEGAVAALALAAALVLQVQLAALSLRIVNRVFHEEDPGGESALPARPARS